MVERVEERSFLFSKGSRGGGRSTDTRAKRRRFSFFFSGEKNETKTKHKRNSSLLTVQELGVLRCECLPSERELIVAWGQGGRRERPHFFFLMISFFDVFLLFLFSVLFFFASALLRSFPFNCSVFLFLFFVFTRVNVRNRYSLTLSDRWLLASLSFFPRPPPPVPSNGTERPRGEKRGGGGGRARTPPPPLQIKPPTASPGRTPASPRP